jgi:ArsR family transcriptional regulator
MLHAVETFSALADPTRLRIVRLLRAMELSVGELAQVLGQSQPRVSRHVKILIDAGLAERRKEGSWVFLTLGTGERMQPLFALLDSWSELDGAWIAPTRPRLPPFRPDRAAPPNAISPATPPTGTSCARSMSPNRKSRPAWPGALGDKPVGELIDIGTGTGRMLELFGRAARRALGVDRSPEMLRLARVKLAQAGVQSELRQGDMYALPVASASADTVILHQVLHYAQQPAAAVAEAAACSAPAVAC